MAFMPNVDLHSHTVHCGHAHPDATPTVMARRAAELGLDAYGISEHCMNRDHGVWLDLIRQEVQSMPDVGIPIYVAVELDPDPVAEDGSFELQPDVDYIIMAPHYLPGGTPHWAFKPDEHSAAERAELGRRWLDWYAATIDGGGFEILAHPLREPVARQLLDLRDAATFRRMVEILERAAEQQMAFELNNGWLHGVREAGQQAEYLRLAREARRLGMRYSRGSDAHEPDHVGGANEIVPFAEALDAKPDDWITVDELLAQHARQPAALRLSAVRR